MHRNVHAPLTQGWHLDGHRGDLIIEILAEAACLHLGLEIAIGRGNHPHIDGPRLAPANGTDFTLLQNPQKLRLKGRGKFAYAIEEDRSAVGTLEKADVLFDSSSESAAAVAEQLAFEGLVRQGRATLNHERPVPAQAVIMKGARDELLARARLAREQDRDVVRRHPPHALANRVHRAIGVAHDAVARVIVLAQALAPRRDDLLRAVRGHFEFDGEQLVLPLQVVKPDGVLERQRQVFGLPGLGHILIDAGLVDALDDVLGVGVARDDHAHGFRPALADGLQELDAR